MENLWPLTEQLIKEHNIACENLTQTQLAAAIIQAIQCGEFMRHVVVDVTKPLAHGQQVTYVPNRELDRVLKENAQLKSRNQQLQQTLQYVQDALNRALKPVSY